MVFSKFISAHVSCTSLMKGSDRFMYLNASPLTHIACEDKFLSVRIELQVKKNFPFSMIIFVQIFLYPCKLKRLVERRNIKHSQPSICVIRDNYISFDFISFSIT